MSSNIYFKNINNNNTIFIFFVYKFFKKNIKINKDTSIKQVAKKNKLDNIKILTQFKNNETNFKYSYSTKKLID